MKNSETSSPVQIQIDNDSLVSMRETKKSSLDSDRQMFSRKASSNPKYIQPMLIDEPDDFELSIEEKAALMQKAQQNFQVQQNLKNKLDNSSGLPTVHEYDDSTQNKSEFQYFHSSGKQSQSGANSESEKLQEIKYNKSKKRLKEQKTKTHLTNQFNDEEGIIQGFKEGLQKKVAEKIQINLLSGSIQDQMNKNNIFDAGRKQTKKNILQLQEIEDPNSQQKVKIERKEEGDGFFYNFKIIQMHSSKCLVAQSLKLPNRKFMFKMLNSSAINLYRIEKLTEEGVQFDIKKPPSGFVGYDIVNNWALLPPQLENQNFQSCYGVMKIKNNYFTVCDLIENYVVLPFQFANLNSSDRNYSFNKFMKNSFYLSNQKNNKNLYTIPNNMYDQIKQMNLGNISNFENIPIFYVKILLEYIIHISRAFAYLHQYNVIHGAFNLSRVVVQKKEIKDAKELQRKIQNALKQYSQGQVENSQVKSQKKGQDDSDSSLLVEQPDEKVFEDLLNMNFIIINFEPWIVNTLKQKFEVDSSLFKDLLSSDFLKLQKEDYQQIAKIFDLQAFGQSIIEIMVGKPKESKLKVQIDSIPLKWSKLPEITQIFEILHMCVGPYDFNNNIQDVNTSKVFKNINKIAQELLEQLNFREKALNENKSTKDEMKELLQSNDQPSSLHLSRLKSAQINNLASIMIFQLSDRVNEEIRRIVLQNIEKTLLHSIQLSQDNAVAHLNFMLFKWSIGEIKDEEFIEFVMDSLYKKDQFAARLMYILFKNNIMGNQVDQKEILEHLEIILNNYETLSNLAINMLQNKTFSREIFMYQEKQQELKEDENVFNRGSSKREFLDQFEQIQESHAQTLTVEIDNNIFKGQKFFFSNNENYVGFVGQKQFIVIDSRSGNIILRQNLPEKQEQQQNHLSETEEQSFQQSPYNLINSQDEKTQNEKLLSASNHQSEIEQINQKKSFSSSASSDDESKVHQVLMPLTIQSLNDATPESQQEKSEIEKRIPSKWIGDIQNTGKILALFDVSQQERNKFYKHKVNKEEILLLYGLQTRLQNSAFTKNIFKLDLQQLLNNQEVLNFGFDDFNTSQQCICIQAKDLYLYIIDYIQHSVLKKIDNQRFSIVMKSIFYNIQSDEYNQKACQFVKEYIQTQEKQGNKVLLPKLNDKFVAIQFKNSNMIKLFSIEQKRIVRQFNLNKDTAQWADKSFDENQDDYHKYNNKKINSKQQQKQFKESLIRKQIGQGESDGKNLSFYNLNGFLNVYQLSSRFRGIKNYVNYMENIKEQSDDSASELNSTTIIDDSNIEIIDISPQGRMIVSLIGNEILIRAVNFYAKTDEIDSFIEQQKMSPFLPIYQDQDYNMNLIYKELLSNYRNSKLVQKFQEIASPWNEDEFQKQDFSQQYSQIKNDIITAANITKITSGTIEKACRFFQNQLKIPAVQNKKSDKLIEVQKFYNVFQKHFQLIYESNINPKKKFNKIEQCLQLVKEFQSLDLKQIAVEQFIGMSKLNTLQSFKFDRSYEYISSFTSSSMSVQTVAVNAITPQAFLNYCATIVNRKVQVYNFISGQLLFEIKIPNASLYCRKNKDIASYKSINFMDADNLLVFQDGESRLCVINVKTQIEAFGDKNLKQVNKDITIKIEKLMGDEESVNYDFGLTLDEKDDKQDKGSDHSDHTGEAQSSKRYIEFGDTIERIFYCRAGSDSAYIALVSKMRFTIYFLQEDYIQPCEYNIAIDMDYRLKREIACMGQIISLDFDDESMTFVTCTKFGWICFWTYQKKSILQKVRIESKFIDPCNIIKYYNQREMVVCFFSRSYKLLLIKVDGLKNKINNLFQSNVSPDHSKNASTIEQDSQIKTPLINTKVQPKNDKKSDKKGFQALAPLQKVEDKKPEVVQIIDPEPHFEMIDLTQHLSYEQKQQRGDVCQIEIDRQYTFLFVVYEKNYLAVFNLITQQEIQVYGPFNASKIFIDEMCTYIAILDEYQKKISYFLLNFQHKIDNLGTQRLSQERKSKSQEKSNKHLKLVSGVEVLFEENENEDDDGEKEKEPSPVKKDEEVKSLEENETSKACQIF